MDRGCGITTILRHPQFGGIRRMPEITMLAIDLDGTLLTDDKRISAACAEAIRDAMNAGLKVCIATGRAWPGAKEFVREIGTDADRLVKMSVFRQSDERAGRGLRTSVRENEPYRSPVNR